MPADRPNILLFLADGMQGQITDPGHPCLAPNLHALAARGTTFRNAHTTLPTCSPARASLMTGLLPHNHGVLQVEHVVDPDQCVLRRQFPHWAQRLSAAGYSTGYFGKWHVEHTKRLEHFGWREGDTAPERPVGAPAVAPATTEELLRDAPLLDYESGPEGYDDVLRYGVTRVPPERREFARAVDGAMRFMERETNARRPWACCVSFSEPNDPVLAGSAAFAGYAVDRMPLPASIHDDLEARPAMYRRVQELYSRTSDRRWQELRCCYYALVTELDGQLGRLVEWLEGNGQSANTVVMLLADHGRSLGAHGLDHHHFGAFEEAYRIPLVAAGPGVASAAVSGAQVGIADLAPTLADLAGAQPLSYPDSRSLVGLLEHPEPVGEEFRTGYAEYYGTRFPLMQRVLWHENWKYVFNGFDYDELYDLESDPYELENLAAVPRHRERCRELMRRIWQRAEATGDRTIIESHYSPLRFAVVGPKAGRPGVAGVQFAR